jgi:hypothetical protein
LSDLYFFEILKMNVPSDISNPNALFGVVDELEEQGENLRASSNSSIMIDFTTLKTPIAIQVIASEYLLQFLKD